MIKSISGNFTQVYHLSAGKTLPEFLKEAGKGKSLRKNKEFRKRLEVLQDFDFPVSSTKVQVSADGQYIGVVGIYPPEVKVFDTTQLGLKFCRRFDSEVVDFRFLSEDYKKLVFLKADRSVEFHAQGGRHHCLRVPKVGRCMDYLKHSAKLLIAGSSHEVYRLDLEAGMFEAPIVTGLEEINCCRASPAFPIVFAGGSDGVVEVFDSREWKSVHRLQVVEPRDDFENGKFVTAMDISADGMMLCAGTSSGVCRVYDIRSSRPLTMRDHRNGLPIIDLNILEKPSASSELTHDITMTIASADRKAVKLWELLNTKRQNRLIASLEAETAVEANDVQAGKHPGAINGVTAFPQSGLLFVAQDNPRIGIYFLPRLGLAPRWCSFLDSLTEEMEETAGEALYDDFQFVTKTQLQDVGAENLIGTSLLRAYMHGYFMDAKLYRKLKAAAKPFEMEEYHKKKLQEKLAQRRPMRLQVKRKLPAVNHQLAARLQETAQMEGKSATTAKSILTDERFSQIFTDPEFAVESLPLSG